MSYRMCDECENIVSNTCWNKDVCPKCGSKDWRSPLDDTRDWDELYKQQMEQLFAECAATAWWVSRKKN